MKITTEFIDHISQLSRLRLPEEEKAKMAGDLEGILAYMDTLNTLDTSGRRTPEPRVPREERAAGGRGAALHGPGGAAEERPGGG